MLDAPERGSPEYWARERPDAVAVVSGDRRLTYGEWDDQANRLADALAGRGLERGDRMGMRFRLDIPWFIVQRALQKLGVAQVAVNWKLTAPEAAYILADSGAAGIACDDPDASGWADIDAGLVLTAGQPTGAPGVRLDDLLAEGKPVERFGTLRPDLVLYTSGTTGRPRGVPPTRADPNTDFDRLARYGASLRRVGAFDGKPTTLLTMPVHHGAGPNIAAGACGRGGMVVTLDPYDPLRALQLIEQHRVTNWTAVPTMLLRIRALPAAEVASYDLSSLQSLTTGAAAVPSSLKRWVIDTLGPDVLWETYGCSEAGMISYLPPGEQAQRPASSGRPHDGVEIAIVDDDWNRLPTGETGEIAVSTPVLMGAYLGAEPLGEDTLKDGFYRTGDVGYLDDEGYVFITDRVKDMIVAGGVNVYPAEIEAVIVEHDDVEDCAVIGIPHDDFGEQPIAFVVPRSGHEVDHAELESFLDGRLAPFKRPRRVEVVGALPTSATGKVLKGELREPYWEGRERRV
jgi:long-chain acyl-CoA synthetase